MPSLSVSRAQGRGEERPHGCVVAGAAIVKLPQILNMVSIGSASGIDFQATFTELVGNTWSASYNAQMGNPLSSYGEAPLIAVQNLVILLLIVSLSSSPKVVPSDKSSAPGALALTGYAIVFVVAQLLPWAVSLASFVETRGNGDWASLSNVAEVATYVWSRVGVVKPEGASVQLLAGLYMANTVLFAASRIPQILTNWNNGHMGPQSLITLLLQALGTLARVFTAIAETGDTLIVGSFAISALLNWTLLLQFFYYWKATTEWRARQAESTKAAAAKKKN
jgi:mannose-P-dolichol utilization defect 1